ncbi:Putative chromate transporter [Septoria linicola]|uniref:Chromate transporter n=1 Tax=Septoria linicola TaxID=215465 RepID=A0A9Q9EIA2_9PEZI|nr:putative chromate transporter [Septoria linicola]USW50879.1 Putative chromate transporter [Septoria linicola]
MPLQTLRTLLSRGRKALLPSGDRISRIAIIDMLAHNWHLGLTAFGGPTVHFQIFRELFVQKYKWLDDSAYDELFAVCQALSGPASTKMLYSINVMRYGLLTGLAALMVWCLPMAIAAWGLALGVGRIEDQLPGPAYALLSGLNSATVGLVALAAMQLSQKAITDTTTRIVVFVGAAAGMLYNALWYFPVLMVAGAATTLVWDLRVLQKIGRAVFGRKRTVEVEQGPDVELRNVSGAHAVTADGTTSSVHSRSAGKRVQEPILTATTDSEEPTTRLLGSWKLGLAIIAAFMTTFVVVMVCRGIYSGDNRAFDLFANLYLAGTIIFGGGPVVIPLLREYTVDPGWVSPRDFLLGLAITQAFPGPNFNFAVYLGTLAVQQSNTPATAGAVIAFLGIFTPGIWLTTGLMGVWSSVRKIQAVRSALRGIHAAAVGLVFTAVYRLFEIGYLDSEVRNGGSLSRDPWWVVIVATSFVGGMHFKLAPPLAILLGAAMGLIWYAVVRVGSSARHL